jgi:hypothetical protein
VKAIENLMKKKGKFDYILIETTGLADPGPIASIFWIDKELGSDVYLDGIVTVIDAKYGLQVGLWVFCWISKKYDFITGKNLMQMIFTITYCRS